MYNLYFIVKAICGVLYQRLHCSYKLVTFFILNVQDEDMLLRKMSELKVAELSTPPMSSVR